MIREKKSKKKKNRDENFSTIPVQKFVEISFNLCFNALIINKFWYFAHFLCSPAADRILNS